MEKRIIITTAFTYGLFRATRLFIMVYGKLIRIVVLKLFLYKTVTSDDFLNVCFRIEFKIFTTLFWRGFVLNQYVYNYNGFADYKYT